MSSEPKLYRTLLWIGLSLVVIVIALAVVGALNGQ